MTNQVKVLPKRADAAREQTWDIEAIYATIPAWEEALKGLPGKISALSEHAGKLGTPEGLLAYLNASDAVEMELWKVINYASMASSVDGKDAEAAARRDRSMGTASQYSSTVAFARPEILGLDEKKLRGWLDTPAFKDQKIRLERILRNKPHVRSAEVEELLGAVQAPFASERGIHPALANMDLDFGTAGGQKVTQGNVDALTSSEDREVRREAWENYADAHLAAKHSQAAMYATNVRQNVFLARARHYPDAITASLTPDAIPTAVVTTLLDTYRRNTPIWHRYWNVRKKWLKLPELREYDVKAALLPRRHVTYQQAVEWIADGMAPLGNEYVEQMKKGLTTERWVDYVENEGKRQGAYSTSGGMVKPFIFMTWNDTMFSYSTLAHEIGHSMHSWLSSFQKPFSIPRYTLFHAEVASNFNQAMSRKKLLQQARAAGDTEFEVQIIEEALSNFHRYFFIMPTLAAFELECYKRIEAGGTLSAPDMIDLMAGLLKEGYGDGVTMDHDRSGSLWMQFSTHLYANFYAYQYTTGISAAHQLLEMFDQNPQAAQENYLRFLRSGGELDPIDALKEAGVDMLTPEPVEATFRTLSGYVDRLEEILKQRQN